MCYRVLKLLIQQFGVNLFRLAALLLRFAWEYLLYVKRQTNQNFKVSIAYLYPCLTDRTATTPLEPTYFLQDSWAAGRIFAMKPEHHYDVGSSVKTIGIISQFVPTTMIDIRPIEIELKNLYFKEGSIVKLPFPDNAIASLSSLCVVEHIGLGRYGDHVDSWGSEKAAIELKRVLQPGGDLLISLPVDAECRVYFNAHRTFTREYVLNLFSELELVEEMYIYGTLLCEVYYPERGGGTGLFHFRKVSTC
jgi:SAM-dependent methyltransferase